MRILIIGHSVKDIIHIGEEEKISPGGIYYSVLGCLSCIDPAEDKIDLITAMNNESEDLFSGTYKTVNSRLIMNTDRIPTVHLKIFDEAERCEFYENISQKLFLGSVDDLNSYDGILINMITGFDLDLEDVQRIRSEYKGPVFMDVHTLSRGIDGNNQRVFRVIPDSGKWISSADILQVNEHELHTLDNLSDELTIVKSALLSGLKYLILTMGNNGARIFWLSDGELNSLYYPAIKVKTNNKVGCGDIFGSVFFCTYIKTQDLKTSFKRAIIAAGCAAGYSNITEFHNLRNDTLARFN